MDIATLQKQLSRKPKTTSVVRLSVDTDGWWSRAKTEIPRQMRLSGHDNLAAESFQLIDKDPYKGLVELSGFARILLVSNTDTVAKPITPNAMAFANAQNTAFIDSNISISGELIADNDMGANTGLLSPVVYDDKILFISSQEKMIAHNINAGHSDWLVTLNAVAGLNSPIIYEDKVFLIDDKMIRPYDLACGTKSDLVHAFSDVISPKAICHNNLIFVATTGYLHCIDAAQDKLIWSKFTSVLASSRIVAEGNNVYVVCKGGAILCFDICTGEILLDKKVKDVATNQYLNPVDIAISGDYLLIKAEGYGLCCLNREDLNFEWTLGHTNRNNDFFAASQTKVVCCLSNDIICCYNIEDCDLLWAYEDDNIGNFPPLIVGDTLHYINEKGRYISLSMEDGREQRVIPFQNGPTRFSPVLYEDKLFLFFNNGCYATIQ